MVYNVFMKNFKEDGELNNLKEELLVELFKDAEMPLNSELIDEQKDDLLRALIILHSGEAVHEKLLVVQDKFLSKYNKKQQIGLDNLRFCDNFCETDENILNFDVDLLAVACTNLLDDAAALYNAQFSLDNEILFRAGVELKAEILSQLNLKPEIYFCDGYNLNAKQLAKIVVDKNVCASCNENDLLLLLQKRVDGLFDFALENGIKSLAIDFSIFQNVKNKEKFLKNLKKYIKNANKKPKIKIIFKNF